MEDNQWGYENKTKWVLYVRAPFSASGLNEIIATAQFRSALLQVAKAWGIRVTKKSGYGIASLRDITKKEESNG